MMPRNWPPLLWSGLWLLVMVSALASRPLMPVDETRYLAVAWDMWREGNFLVPHLNGEPYSHKPPLLFWLIHLGWAAFGVNEWWPRLVAPLFGLGSLFLTARLARELWPEASAAARMAPLVLFGGLFWALFTTLTMFDMILAFCTLLSLIGMVRAWRASGPGDGPGGDQGGEWFGFGLMGLGIGLGVLAKGPAILVHILPVALLAPWWGRALPGGEDRRSGGWYLGLFGAVALGAAIGLAWAVPAGIAGGEAYREAIFWGQSAGRMVSSFAHRQPWWWYGAALPVLLLPWVLWPPIWGAAGRLPKALGRDGGVRFCIAWLIPALVIFSIISGKQFHYLLPELPAIALVLARLLFDGVAEKEGAARDQIPPGLFYVIAGIALFALPALPVPEAAPSWLDLVATGWGLAMAAAGVVVLFRRRWPLAGRLGALAVLSAVFVVVIHLAMKPPLAAAYDLKPLALKLAEWQRQGISLANFSKYHGQYQFLGRLEKPITQVGILDPDLRNFLADHADGRIVAYHNKLPTAAKPIAVYRFRTRLITVWEVATVIRHPGILERAPPARAGFGKKSPSRP